MLEEQKFTTELGGHPITLSTGKIARLAGGAVIVQSGETVLLAYRDVEDALSLERHQQERIALINSQLVLARQTSDQLRQQYLNGVTDYVAVLVAVVAEQRLQRDALSARLELVLTRIALYLALAGDFEIHTPDRGTYPGPEYVNDE